jgi:hypothetical protein
MGLTVVERQSLNLEKCCELHTNCVVLAEMLLHVVRAPAEHLRESGLGSYLTWDFGD